MEAIPRLAADASPQDISEALDIAGCCVIEALASPTHMDAIASEMADHVTSTPRGTTDFAGAGTRRTGMLLERSPTFRDHLVRHPAILGAGQHVLGHAPTWNLSFAHYFELFPDEPAQPLHRDTWKYGHDFGVEVDLAGLWLVDEFTETNGATRFVPGSHLWDHHRRPVHGEDQPAVAPKGSLVLYMGKTFHGGGANTSSSDVRLAVNVQHGPGWIAPTERLLLEYPPAVVADWDDDLIRFIGYQRSGPATGHWRNAEDPFTAVLEHRQMRG